MIQGRLKGGTESLYRNNGQRGTPLTFKVGPRIRRLSDRKITDQSIDFVDAGKIVGAQPTGPLHIREQGVSNR
jgi:hypothetical protein